MKQITLGSVMFGILMLATSLALVRRALLQQTPMSRLSVACAALAAMLAAFYVLTFRSFVAAPRSIAIATVVLMALSILTELAEILVNWRKRSAGPRSLH